MKPIAIVIPWFGKDLKGGAEQLTFQFATRLANRGHAVEILTTCCRSFQDDWSTNHYRPGIRSEGGLRVRRFRVDRRDRARFDQANTVLLSLASHQLKPGFSPVGAEITAAFCDENVHSSALLAHLKHRQQDYHAFLFIPYLYGPILKGLPLVADRAFLQPCLHDEVYAYLPAIAELFHQARGVLFNSEGEFHLAQQLYGPGLLPKGVLVGGGVEVTPEQKQTIPRIKDFHLEQQPFALYMGRRDPTKNVDMMVEAYRRFRQNHPESHLQLVLVGPGNQSYTDVAAGIIDLGLVSEAEKATLLAHCLALFQPSRNESLSRVMMEAWFYRRPVAVHRDCLATAIAVETAGGGWLADSTEEWADLFARVDQLDESHLSEYGDRGYAYAQEHGSWERVIDRYEAILELKTPPTPRPLTMSPRRLGEIHQILPTFGYGDAISNHTLYIRNYLRQQGYRSDIYTVRVHDWVAQEAKILGNQSLNSQAGLIYHHSIGSEVTPHVLNHQGPRCLIYHNITPAVFFQPYRPDLAKILHQGRLELGDLAPHFTLSVGDSAYNALELAEVGFLNPGVLPIAVFPQKWDRLPDPTLMAQLQDGKTNLLFVGRIAPNKRQEHLVEAFAHYLTFDSQARLILAGYGDPGDPYYQHVCQTIQRFNLNDSVQILGHISDAQLLALYRTAHLYWSMSEHEGFCVPLIEAMWFDIPVLAYKSSAVPETLADAGILFTDKTDWAAIAALAKLLVHDPGLQAKVLKAQRRRREAFTSAAVDACLAPLVAQMEAMHGKGARLPNTK